MVAPREELAYYEYRRKLTPELIANIRKKGIDLSDIPELSDEEAMELYPKSWKPIKKPISLRIDMDNLEWLKEKGSGYQERLNNVIRWARANCPY